MSPQKSRARQPLEPTPVRPAEGEPDCEPCPHPWLDHDGMGNCHHLDRRSKSGYCAGHETRPDITEEPTK